MLVEGQIQELKVELIQAKQQQKDDIVGAFKYLSLQGLNQQAKSGELRAELEQASSIRPMGKEFNLLEQVEARSQNQKRLPGS